MTKILQQLDVYITRSFENKLCSEWEKWMIQDAHSFTDRGRMCRAYYAEIAEWMKTAWETISASTIKNSFTKCEICTEKK